MRSRSKPPSRTFGGRSRFSSTVRLAKIPRSSGQMASPKRAIWFEGSAIVSAPPKVTEPCRRPTMPMIDFRVVVLPAPLRPSSVTTSPSPMSKSMPCRMCDSPYQAWRPLTSSMAGSKISLYNLRIFRHRGVVACGEDFAAREHRDRIGELGNHGKVVLDHEHRAVRRHALDERGDALDVRVRHAGRRL